MPDINNAKTQVSSDVHTHIDNTNEHIIHELLNFKGFASISIDLSLIRLDLQIKVHEKVDGVNYRIKSFKTFDQARFDISSVNDDAGDAEFITTLPHGLVVGETIIHRDFISTVYNGTFVVSVITATTYKLTGVSFSSTSSGYLIQEELTNDFAFGQQTVVANIEGSGNDVKLTFQSQIAEVEERDVPLTIRETVL